MELSFVIKDEYRYTVQVSDTTLPDEVIQAGMLKIAGAFVRTEK